MRPLRQRVRDGFPMCYFTIATSIALSAAILAVFLFRWFFGDFVR